MTTTTVTASYLNPDETACSGRVVFQLVAATYHDGLDAIFPTVPITAVLDTNGDITVELEPTSGVSAEFDADDMTYQVRERINGADRAVYYVDIPTASSVDLGTLATYDDPPVIARQYVIPDLTDLGYQTGDDVAATIAAASVSLIGGLYDLDPPLLTAHSPSAITGFVALTYNTSTGVCYGIKTSNGHFATSVDDGVTIVDRTFSPVTYFGAGGLVDLHLTTSFMYAVTDDGNLYRTALDVWNGWVDISVPVVPTYTTGRPSIFAVSGDGTYLLYCNYNSSPVVPEGAYMWRSLNNGTSWTQVYSLPDAKHSHAVKLDPWHAGHVYFSVGDAGFDDIGLHKSTDYGATWTNVTPDTTRYGIDIVFPEPVDGVPEWVLLEGDGASEPLLMRYVKGGDTIYPAVWFTGNPSDPDSTRGTSRGIGLTSHGDCVFFTTTETGAVGVNAGVYVAARPWFDHAELLEDITGAEPVGYTRTFEGDTHTIQRAKKFNVPRFGL